MPPALARGPDATTLPSGVVTTPTLVLPRPGPRTPPPRHPRRGLRRAVTLAGLLVIGGALGGTGAVVEPLLTGDGTVPERRPAVPVAEVVRALRPIGTSTLAAGEFATEVWAAEADDEAPVFVGVGHVQAWIDFARVGPDDVRMVDGGSAVRIRLPAVVLGEPVLDEGRSGVVEAEDDDDLSFGLLDVLYGWADPPRFELDEERLRAAAIDDLAGQAATSELHEDARRRALDLVRGRLARFAARGLDRVDVRFDPLA